MEVSSICPKRNNTKHYSHSESLSDMKPSLGALPPAVAQPPPPTIAIAGDPYYLHPPSQYPGADPHRQQRVLTLFVAGLPDDVKPREIHNIFRRCHGFDHSQLEYTGRGNQVVAFVTFFTHQSAIAAMNALNGMLFDPETRATLHIELARSNSRKRSHDNEVYKVIDKRVKRADDDPSGDENENDEQDDEVWGVDGDDDGSDAPSGTENEKSSDMRVTADQSGEEEQQKEKATSNEQPEKSSSADIPPCSTLFIANLGPTCTEDELKEILSKHSGFHVLKLRNRGAMPVAFADFTDIESSTAAMNSLQGTVLGSSDRGGMHLEYARSKMRKS